MNSDDTPGSTGRLHLAPAPGGLCLVQDLLNSAGVPVASVPDLLADETTAQAWVDGSLRTWGGQTGRSVPTITISGADLAVLRDLRGRLTDGTTFRLEAEVSFPGGEPAYRPGGDGAAAVASLVLLETLLASHAGTLRRLKTCQNPDCGAAFYDLSRNGTRVWHDMKTCGNAINLRASRARRRKPAETPGPTG